MLPIIALLKRYSLDSLRGVTMLEKAQEGKRKKRGLVSGE